MVFISYDHFELPSSPKKGRTWCYCAPMDRPYDCPNYTLVMVKMRPGVSRNNEKELKFG